MTYVYVGLSAAFLGIVAGLFLAIVLGEISVRWGDDCCRGDPLDPNDPPLVARPGWIDEALRRDRGAHWRS